MSPTCATAPHPRKQMFVRNPAGLPANLLETDRSGPTGEEELGEHAEAKRLDRGDETSGLN